MASLFISYSRKDIDAARKLTETFKGQDLDFWIDWEGIPPTVDWWKEIQKGIEEADIFLFILSPDSCASKVCKQEIEHAAKNGKRLIPVVVRNITADESPLEVQHLNWIFLRGGDDFNTGSIKLITAIKTDYVWVQAHRQLQVKALEWERSNHENSFLLRGKELQDAEFQLSTNTSKEPHPTNLQREYVLKSRQASDHQRRRTRSIAIAVIIALAALAVYGFVQARIANERATLSQAREFAAQSIAVRDTQLDLSLLFAIEAFRIADIPRTRNNLLDIAAARPEISQYWHGTSMALSPDGQVLAAGEADGSILLWNMATRQMIGTSLKGHTAQVWSLLFSPDGKTLVSSGMDNSIIIWDLETQPPRAQSILGDPGNLSALAFSPDGKSLASATWDDIITFWDVKTGQIVGEALTAELGGIGSLAFSPDGKILATGGWPDILLWDLATGQVIGQPLVGHTEPVNTLAFSPDGKTLASGGDDNSVILWDVETEQAVGEPLRAHLGVVYSIAFTQDGKTLASAGSDNTIILWDVETRQAIGQPLTGHTTAVFTLAFSPDGLTLVSNSLDSTILVWDRAVHPPIAQRLTGHAASALMVVFSPDGKMLASGSCAKWTEKKCLQGQIILWDVNTQQVVGRPMLAHADWIQNLAFSPDSKILVSAACGEDVEDPAIDDYKCVRGEIILWNMQTKPVSVLRTIETAGPITGLAVSPGGQLLASASCPEQVADISYYKCVQGQIILWDLETGKAVDRPMTEASGRVGSIAFSPDGNTLAAGNRDYKIILWNVTTQNPIGQPLTGQRGSVSSVVFSPDGKHLASIGAEGSIILWDVATHTAIRAPLKGFATGWSATGVAFSPDGKTLASSSGDKTILLWDVETHQLINLPLKGHSGAVYDVAFSPDGRLLASAGADAIILWKMDPQSWIKISCQRAGRNFTRAEWAVYFSSDSYPAKQEEATCPQWPLEPEPVATISPTP